MNESTHITRHLGFLFILFISITLHSQSRWHPYMGLHISGDAELYYIGPTFQMGTNYDLNRRFAVGSYVHFFSKNIDKAEVDGSFEKGRFRSTTAAILLEAKFGKSNHKYTFLAGGLAYQQTSDDFSSSWTNWQMRRAIIIPALRVGYAFPFVRKNLTVELNATGPYTYRYEDMGITHDMIEVITKLSLGCRFVL